MWDSLFTVMLYGGVGMALVAAVVWYVGAVYSMLTGKGEVIIAPFEIVRANGEVDKAAGAALAHMLQVQLREIEQGIEAAQAQLVSPPPQGRAATPEQSVRPSPGSLAIVPIAIPVVLIQGVGLQTKLLAPADIKVSVAGVEVGQVLPWVQRQLVNQRTVVFTVYEKEQGVRVTGALRAMGIGNDSLALNVKTDGAEKTVPLDRVVERMAYEIMRRRLAADPDNRVEALDEVEFQSLVEVLRETARLNLQIARGRTAPVAFQALLQTASKLAENVDSWYQLNHLTANIAESAKDWDTALKFYRRTQNALPSGARFNDLRKSVEAKITDVQAKIAAEAAPLTVGAGSPQAEQAQHTIEEHVKEAAEFFNNLLEQKLKPPAVKLQTDPSLKYNPYFDGVNTIVAAEDVQFLPDLSFRDAAWPHLLALTGVAIGSDDDLTDILYSTVDVLTMLMHQHYLKQDAATSDWALGKGYIEWVSGKTLTKPFEGTPWVSFARPGEAYNDPKVGKDRQVAHMRNRSKTRDVHQYVNSGILDRAFYLVATKRTTDRAAELWIGALRKLKKAGRVDYQRFARLLYEDAGPDKDVVRAALAEVGLDVEKPAAATTP